MAHVKPTSAPEAPLHRRVRDGIEELIRTSSDKNDFSLSDADLGQRFGVSRITVRRAVNELVAAGLLYRIRGLGTFVRPRKLKEKLTLTSFLDAWAGESERLDVKVSEFRRMPASEEVAERLGLKPGAGIVYIRRMRYQNKTLVAVDDRYLPTAYCNKLKRHDITTASLVDYLRDRETIDLSHGEMEIEARGAERADAIMLGVRLGQPVLVRRLIFFTRKGEPALSGTSTYRADRVSYRLTISA